MVGIITDSGVKSLGDTLKVRRDIQNQKVVETVILTQI